MKSVHAFAVALTALCWSSVALAQTSLLPLPQGTNDNPAFYTAAGLSFPRPMAQPVYSDDSVVGSGAAPRMINAADDEAVDSAPRNPYLDVQPGTQLEGICPSCGQSPCACQSGSSWHGWNCLKGRLHSPWHGTCDTCDSACDMCCNPCCTSWFGGIGGLVMNRDKPNFHQLSFDDTDPVGQVLSTFDSAMQWSGGIEARVGRWFCGGAWGMEAVYWGIYSDIEQTTVFASDLVGNLNTVFDLQPLNIGADNVNDLYDAAQAHRLTRSYEFHNVELNFLQGGVYGSAYGYGRGLTVTGMAGLRFFKFGEGFQYASADTNPVFGADPATECYYDIDVENNLFGVQLGANMSYGLTDRLIARALPRIGVFGNHVRHHSRIYNVNGTAVVGPGNPLVGEPFDVTSSQNDVSFLGEIDLGMVYRVTPVWAVAAGYRAVGITGVALSTNQIPSNFADIPGVADIDTNGSLILHGGYARIEAVW